MKWQEILDWYDLHDDIPFLLDKLGKQIGRGGYRTVYQCKFDDVVYKIVREDARVYHNQNEWQMWYKNEHRPWITRYLAPCLGISENHKVLVQKRVQPLTECMDIKEITIPKFLRDEYRTNLGLLDKQVVALDYGYIVPGFFEWCTTDPRFLN